MRKSFHHGMTVIAVIAIVTICCTGCSNFPHGFGGSALSKPNDAVAVDLGLPSGTLWANMNVGATSPYDAGCYFQWGETIPCADTTDVWTFTNYAPGGEAFMGTSLRELGTEKDPMVAGGMIQSDPYSFTTCNIAGNNQYDAATANWGDDWSTPTLLQVRELLSCCTLTQRTLDDGSVVYKVVGPSGDSIFIAGAYCKGANADDDDPHNAVLWSSTLGPNFGLDAHLLVCGTDGFHYTLPLSRNIGCNVRPVIAGRDRMQEAQPQAVDLALPSGTLWADMNVGACSPEEYGDYFQWGETVPCTFKSEHLSMPINYAPGFTPVRREDFGTEKDPLYIVSTLDADGWWACNIAGKTKFDAATANWGRLWCMPTKAQMDELFSECELNMCSRGGVNGLLVTGRNGNSIFLPAAGQRAEDEIYFEGRYCDYWTSESFSKYDVHCIKVLMDREHRISGVGTDSRRLGFCVRAVMATVQTNGNTDEPQTATDGTTITSDIVPIDLGLPSGTKWANMNVGASSPDEPGGYYAWGETETKNNYDVQSYAHFSGGTLQDIGNNIANTQYDVVHVKWGGRWHMPTKEQFEELMEYCTWTIEERANSNGFLIKARNQSGKSIFLPAVGSRAGTDLPGSDMEMQGAYWTATASGEKSTWCFTSSDDIRRMDENGYRPYGLCIRAVTE